jgi:hypothetical protein
MTKKSISSLIILLFFFLGSNTGVAQNSLLVNFGTSSCSGSAEPSFSFINNPLGVSPSPLTSCNLKDQLPNIFGVFIAYNPKNNKTYVADVRNFTETKIWVLDMGLPDNIACPAVIPATPDYTYSYVSNNFEFDNNGDLWSFSNYNDTVGQCNMDKFDVTTGAVINSRIVQFPAGNFPSNITSGDLTILPNGRMFATLGNNPSRLYEIKNYSSSTNATATYLTTLPQNCFGIAYLNGQLEITGFDASGCYYFDYNITGNILGNLKNFQNGQLPIDNTSITPSLGVTKQLLNVFKVNDNTADLTYEIFVRNLGDVALNDINVTDNLASVFGNENISNVTTSFVPGANSAGLILNPLYNGNAVSHLLNGHQNLPNQTSVNTDYFFKVRLGLRVTNLNGSDVYMNSAIGIATIGGMANSSLINVSDSSNNGAEDVVDPNNNGNAGEPGENVPTPFNPVILPVRFISIAASLIDNTSCKIKWQVATPTVNADKFEIEYSVDGRNWNNIGLMSINNTNQSNYEFLHTSIPVNNLYYRIREIDLDGSYIYSNVVLVRGKKSLGDFIIFPNPANNYIDVTAPYYIANKTEIILYDATGKMLISKTINSATGQINTGNLSNGAYLLRIINDGAITTRKILIMHK